MPQRDPGLSKWLTAFVTALAVTVVALLTVLVVLLVQDDGGDAAATTAPSTTRPAATTEPPPTTTAPTLSTTTSPPATTAPATSAPTSTTTATTTTPTSATTTTTVPFAGDTGDEQAPGPMFSTFALLENIRFAQRGGFTRVVFDFRGTEVPWWQIGYASPPFVGAAGSPVTVDGDAFLRLVLSASGVDLSGPEFVVVYQGPDVVDVDSTSVTEVARVEDFEGISEWVIGVKGGEKPFLVGTLLDPPRIYVDIAD